MSTDRALEAVAVIGGGMWHMVAQVAPVTVDMTSWVSALKTAAELSPSAILLGVVVVLWRRYTSREDKMSDLQERNIQALQRVADALEKIEQTK